MDNDSKTTTEDQVSWNLSDSIIKQIASLLISATENYTTGQFKKCFLACREIRILIYADMGDIEVTKLKDIEKNFNKWSSNIDSTNNNKSKYKMDRAQASTLMRYHLDNYRDNIMTILSSKGYLVQKKTDTARMF